MKNFRINQVKRMLISLYVTSNAEIFWFVKRHCKYILIKLSEVGVCLWVKTISVILPFPKFHL